MSGQGFLELQPNMEESRLYKIADRISSASARKNFLDFVNSIDAIEEEVDPEEEAMENEHDGDGVVPLCVADLKDQHKERLEQFSSEFTGVFPASKAAAVITDPLHIDFRGEWGMTKLHCAVENEDISIVKDLLARGADRSIQDTSHRTAYDLASRNGFVEIMDLLRV